MTHTVRVICDATAFDESVTVSCNALVLDLFAAAGLTDPVELLAYRPVYYRSSCPVRASIVQSVRNLPKGETLFVHERETPRPTRK